MDSTESGGKKPEENAAQTAPVEEKAAEEKPPRKERNWTLIALIAVSIIAVLLLAATIGLAVTGDCDHHGRCDRFERPGGPGPMMRWRDNAQRQGGPPWQQQGQPQQPGQPQQSAPTAPQGGQTP